MRFPVISLIALTMIFFDAPLFATGIVTKNPAASSRVNVKTQQPKPSKCCSDQTTRCRKKLKSPFATYRKWSNTLKQLHEEQTRLLDDLLKRKAAAQDIHNYVDSYTRTMYDFPKGPRLPFRKEMSDLPTLLKNLQSGKIKYSDCKGKTYSEILKKIQKNQCRILHEYYKKENRKAKRRAARRAAADK